ncbi:MAG: hypothetical protein JNL81_04520 [Hyphomonadaceae bacterium]|nr:hypothetical protein [Hyphomonadaceae bacterium]
MSLNKTLDRLFDEIRREAKRNPEFADRLDAVLQRHDSRRDVADEVLEDVAESSPASGGGPSAARGGGKSANRRAAPPQSAAPTAPPQAGEQSAQALNPAGLYKKEGEDALTAALADHDLSALRALVAEHNLDPSGVTPSLTRDELAAHIVSQAKRRAERDEKMFDY